MGKVYISGPMSGRDEHNFPAFHRAAKRWRDAGWEVVNPAENFGGDRSLDRPTYLREDVRCLSDDDMTAIALLEEWETSNGAVLETMLGLEFGLDFYDADTMDPIRPVLAVQAVQLEAEVA